MGDTDDSGDGPDEVECPKRKPKTCKACDKVDDRCFEESEKLSAHCEKLCSGDDNDNDNNDDNDNDNDNDNDVDEEKPKCPKKPKSCKACQNADEQCMEDEKFAKNFVTLRIMMMETMTLMAPMTRTNLSAQESQRTVSIVNDLRVIVLNNTKNSVQESVKPTQFKKPNSDFF